MIMIMIMIMVTVHVLSDGENCEILRSLVLSQYQRVTDRQTDGQTDTLISDRRLPSSSGHIGAMTSEGHVRTYGVISRA